MTATYPTYAQPILQAASGARWYLEVNASGTLIAGGRTLDQQTNLDRVTLCSTDEPRTMAYRLGLDAADPPSITATPMAVDYGRYELLSIFARNGREWGLTVSAAGAMTLTALVGTVGPWKRAESVSGPSLISPNGQTWTPTMDGMILSWTSQDLATGFAYQGMPLVRAKDDSAVFGLSISNAGILTVTDTNPVTSLPYRLADTPWYEVDLVTADGLVRTLQFLDNSGLVTLDSNAQDVQDSRDEWPVVLATYGDVLYVVDSRFRPPVPGFRPSYRSGYVYRPRWGTAY